MQCREILGIGANISLKIFDKRHNAFDSPNLKATQSYEGHHFQI